LLLTSWSSSNNFSSSLNAYSSQDTWEAQFSPGEIYSKYGNKLAGTHFEDADPARSVVDFLYFGGPPMSAITRKQHSNIGKGM